MQEPFGSAVTWFGDQRPHFSEILNKEKEKEGSGPQNLCSVKTVCRNLLGAQ